ncbi:MAG: MauE/DoxX family redox-associated membrane protein [Syntrophaceae bacterium]
MSLQHVLDSLKTTLQSRWPDRVIRGILAFLFIYGGGLKLADPKAFAATLSHYDLLPEMLLPVVAVGLPALEVIAGMALLFNLPGGLTVITGLLALFVAVLGYGILTDLNVDCGCFGPEEVAGRQSLRQAFIRDLLLIGAASFLYYTRRTRAKLKTNRLP